MVLPAYRPLGMAACSRCGGRHAVMRSPTGAIVADACGTKRKPSASMDHPGLVKVKPKHDGSHAENALYAALRIKWHELGGGDDLRFVEQIRTCWSRQYPWGAYLSPPRRFSADAGFPVARLLVEVEGQAHSIKGRRKGDVLKSQLAEAAGWKVLRLLPEQVHDGSAVQLIAAALAARNNKEGS